MRGRPSFPGSGRVSTDRLRESLGEIRAGSGLTPPLVAAHPYMQQADTHTQQRQTTAKKKRRKKLSFGKGRFERREEKHAPIQTSFLEHAQNYIFRL